MSKDKKGHYDGIPGARNTQVGTWQQFSVELDARASEIASMLPAHVTAARFHACALAAVKQNPDLLQCTPRSLFGAITKSAQDGILPDGREGVITAYKGEAKWNPMTYGLRKRARELDHILIDAQVVRENDHFVWHQGDAPSIEHEPAKLGTPRGEMIGVYAIFKREDGLVLHREVLDSEQVEAVHSVAQAQNSLMWTKFVEEGWRKTAVRRGIKSVPCSESLESIVRRDDDNFDFSTSAAPVDDGTMIPPRPDKSAFARDFEDKDKKAPKAEVKPKAATAEGAADPRPEPPAEGEPVVAQSTMKPAEPEPEDEEDVETSDAFDDAEKRMLTYAGTVAESKDLDDFKVQGRALIDSFKTLSEDEVQALRGQFTRLVLEETRARSKRGSRK